MKDTFLREVNYLRISVTDFCNLRCTYCMGKDGVSRLPHDSIMSPERIKEVVDEAVKLGITKVRITGGEPLVRKGILDICRYISSNPKIKELCLTTNGTLLEQFAKSLKEAGVDRLNISLDTLNKDKYRKITRVGDLDDVLKGIKAAKEAGFDNIKINTVLIGEFNDDEIKDFANYAADNQLTLRFIELMPIGVSSSFDKKCFISNDIILKKLESLEYEDTDGVSRNYVYKHNGHQTKIGLISPLSKRFCESCSRIRLTADGKLKPCLHSSLELSTNGLEGEDLKEMIKKAILLKPKEHHLESGSESLRKMHEIGG